MKTRVRLSNIAHDCLWKQSFISNSLQAPSNLLFFIILITMRPLTQFQLKLTGANLQKKCEFCLT